MIAIPAGRHLKPLRRAPIAEIVEKALIGHRPAYLLHSARHHDPYQSVLRGSQPGRRWREIRSRLSDEEARPQARRCIEANQEACWQSPKNRAGAWGAQLILALLYCVPVFVLSRSIGYADCPSRFFRRSVKLIVAAPIYWSAFFCRNRPRACRHSYTPLAYHR